MTPAASDAQKEGTSDRISRFVVLLHDHPFEHWDLMLERETALRTWRLLDAPAPDVDIRAEPLGDHRLHYLDYEGPVSGNRGSVSRWDRGSLEVLEQTESLCRCRVAGGRLTGIIELRTAGPDEQWVFRYSPTSADSG